MNKDVYEKTRYQNIKRHKKNKNYVIVISKPKKTSISRINNKKIYDIEQAIKIRNNIISKATRVDIQASKEDFKTLWDKYIYDCQNIQKLAYSTVRKKIKLYNKYLREFNNKKISSIITDAGKGIIVAINKWDLIENKKSNTINQFEKNLTTQIPFLSYAPKIFISAVTKQRLGQIFEETEKVYEHCTKRISTGLLNKVINEAYALNPPTSYKGKRLKILYITQAATQPPTFVLFVNNEQLLSDSYKRYLENKLREAFGFFGTPIRISARERKEKK